MSKRSHAQSENVQAPHPSHDVPPAAKTAERPHTGSQPVASQQQADAVPDASDLHDRVAKTHAELVALEKQGKRRYIEFSLKRSRHFQALGPLTIQLRKADIKHSYCDLRFTVNGRALDKNHVNLYEPIWITLDDHAHPLEFVVNGMKKSRVSGYLSEPKNGNVRLARK